MGVVERVIDGDTVEVSGNSVRLLGINSPEKGELYSSEAQEFLEMMVLNKTVKMERSGDDLDLYGRKLRYLIIGETNINLELVKEGLANFYFPSGKSKYYNEFKETWEGCVEENTNLCARSEDLCSSCIALIDLDKKAQKVNLYNLCNFNCNLNGWTIKDEGRKTFTFSDFKLSSKAQVDILVGEGTDSDSTLYWPGEDYVWTNSGDTLFLRDDKGKLVLWENY